MVRQFVDEEDIGVELLIDQSSSMRFGTPLSKFDFALQVAGALSYVATNSIDRLAVSTFDSSLNRGTRGLRGRAHLHSVIRFLENLRTTSDNAPLRTDLAVSTRMFSRNVRRRGVLFVISDFLDAGDYRRELRHLAQRHSDVNLIQVLSHEEVSPELIGDLQVVDSETGSTEEVTINSRVLAAYNRELKRFTDDLEAFCRTNGLRYTRTVSDTPLEQFLLKNLIASRMVC